MHYPPCSAAALSVASECVDPNGFLMKRRRLLRSSSQLSRRQNSRGLLPKGRERGKERERERKREEEEREGERDEREERKRERGERERERGETERREREREERGEREEREREAHMLAISQCSERWHRQSCIILALFCCNLLQCKVLLTREWLISDRSELNWRYVWQLW